MAAALSQKGRPGTRKGRGDGKMRSSEAMELLGFPPYSRPSPSEVKAASRRMVVESHPDRVPTHQKSQAESKFKQISEAYSCLKDGVGWKQFPLVPSALQEHTSGKRRSVPPRTLFFHGGRSL